MLTRQASHVHFLEPASDEDRFNDHLSRPTLLSEEPESDRPGVVAAQVFLVEDESVVKVLEALRSSVIPAFTKVGAVSLGLFVSSDEPNNFPALPFIEDEEVVVWFAGFESREWI